MYAYTNRIYSSRQIAKQLKENIYFMWLSGNQTPDFRTINRFRSERMMEVIYETFFSIVDLLRQEGLVQLEDYFLDGTKIEAHANKYTFVWRKSTEKYDRKLDEKFRQIVASIKQVTKEDEEAEQEKEEAGFKRSIQRPFESASENNPKLDCFLIQTTVIRHFTFIFNIKLQ